MTTFWKNRTTINFISVERKSIPREPQTLTACYFIKPLIHGNPFCCKLHTSPSHIRTLIQLFKARFERKFLRITTVHENTPSLNGRFSKLGTSIVKISALWAEFFDKCRSRPPLTIYLVIRHVEFMLKDL